MTSRHSAGRVRIVAGLLALLALGACSFERRAETDAETSPTDSTDPVSGVTAEEALMGVIEAYHRALGSGDAARLSQIVGPDALLVDQEEGVLWSATSAGPLPSSLQAPEGVAGGLAWERVGTRVDTLGAARLVIQRYRATVAGEPIPWWGVESVLMQPGSTGGWRIHFVHRSRGPGGAGGLR